MVNKVDLSCVLFISVFQNLYWKPVFGIDVCQPSTMGVTSKLQEQNLKSSRIFKVYVGNDYFLKQSNTFWSILRIGASFYLNFVVHEAYPLDCGRLRQLVVCVHLQPLADAYGLLMHRNGQWEWTLAPGVSSSPRYQHAAVSDNFTSNIP